MKKAVPAIGLADGAFVDQLARGLVRAAEEGVGRAADPHALGLRRVDQLARLGDGDAERLLRMDVLAGGDGLQADLDMRLRHGQVEDDLDRGIGEQRVDGLRRDAEFRCRAPRRPPGLRSASRRCRGSGRTLAAFRYGALMLPEPIRPIPMGCTSNSLGSSR